MGSSSSSADEWIELRNLTTQEIDLSGWLITKKSGGSENVMLEIPEGEIIPAQSFYLIANYDSEASNSQLDIQPDLVETDVSLINSGLQIKLYDSQDQLVDTADDGSGKPLAGGYVSGEIWKSMERISSPINGTVVDDWKTATDSINFDSGAVELGTPRAPNSNSAPIAVAGPDSEVVVGEVVTFDGSESSDPDDDQLAFTWDFGDGQQGGGVTPTHTYDTVSEYNVVLIVSDGISESSDDLVVNVVVKALDPEVPINEQEEDEENEEIEPPAPPVQNENNQPEEEDNSTGSHMTGDVIINELFPNPEGKDQEGEFIELYNQEAKDIDLNGWEITDGKKSYLFEAGMVIEGNEFLWLPYSRTKLVLKNGGGLLQLVDPFDAKVNGVEYPSAKEGESFARINLTNNWDWTEEVTPGSENEFAILEELKPGEEMSEPEKKTEKETALETDRPLSIDIVELNSLASRTLVQLTGTVIAEPGMFSVSNYWIVDETGGVEVYSSSKQFPDLVIGDQVKVIGTVSTSGIGRKINQKKDQVEIIGKGEVELTEFEISDLSDSDIGQLVEVQGKAVKATKQKLEIAGESGGSIEIVAKKGTGLSFSDIEVDESVSVVGVLGSGSNGLQLWPRVEDDIELGGEVLSVEVVENETEQDQASSVTSLLVDDDKKSFPSWIVLVVVLMMLGAGGWWYWRKKKEGEKQEVI
ncbi:lamin tail domain-containing protein [Patescibacteria group bacterium]|nr:lamin tail domain-containing protein [Patescibacteria group bacterium]